MCWWPRPGRAGADRCSPPGGRRRGGLQQRTALDHDPHWPVSMGIELHIPAPSLCGDNAAMLAVPGNYYLEHGLVSAPDLDVTATWEMDRIKEIFCE